MASSSTRPPKDENGRIAHYESTTSEIALKRGVLISSAEDRPAVQWHRLLDTFTSKLPELNCASWHVVKTFGADKLDEIKKSIKEACSLAFPNRAIPEVLVYLGVSYGKAGTYIGVRSTADGIHVRDIVAIAALRRWTAEGSPLGSPWLIALQTDEMLLGIEFTKVPEMRRDDFAKDLQPFIEERLHASQKVEIIDVWENQVRASIGAEWQFDGTFVVLIRVRGYAADVVRLREFVAKWPGWWHWNNEHLIEIHYAGRYKFCTKCKHTAQDVDGPTARHPEDRCISVICGNCGHRGHDSTVTTPASAVEANKRICEEGREERLKASCAKKRKSTSQATKSNKKEPKTEQKKSNSPDNRPERSCQNI